MPALNEAQLRKLIEQEDLTLLSIDTSVFEKYGNGLEHGLLKHLSQFNKTKIEIALSEVIIKELKTHMVFNAETAKSKLTKPLKEVGGAWDIGRAERDAAIESLFGNRSAGEVTEERVKAFLESIEATVVEIGQRVKTDDLLERYFQTMTPFEKTSAKKNEFPDAVALMSLEHFADERKTMMLVVSADNGWEQFARESDRLACIGDLGEALSLFQPQPAVYASVIEKRLRTGLLPEVDNAISEKLSSFLDWMTIEADAEVSTSYIFDAEVYDRQLLSFSYAKVPPLVPIEVDAQNVVVELTVVAEVEVSATFEFSVRDPVDKDYFSVGSAYVSQTLETPFTTVLTLFGDPKSELEVVNCEFVQWEDRVNFGHVEPDWGDPD